MTEEKNINSTEVTNRWAEIDKLEAEIELSKLTKRSRNGVKAKRIISNTAGHIVLSVLGFIWLIPLIYLVLQSFKKEHVAFSTRFFPQNYTLDNYKALFSPESWDTGFMKWYGNTLFVSVFSALFTTIFVLMVAYAFSHSRFKARKPIMNVMLILGMFPGFMSMTAIYFLLKALNAPSTLGLILVYSGGAAMSYYVSKGFFDTIPKSLDEAARIDGASRFRVFCKIILPLSKPIIIYTILVSFIAPWCDFIFASLITGASRADWTVAVGMRDWVTNRSNLNMQFGVFCAASVVVATPITALFMWLQKYYVQGVTGGAVKG